MRPLTPLSMLGVPVLAATLTCLATNASSQSLDSILNAADKADLDSLASHTAQRIINADRTEPKPRVLVVDFFLGSPGCFLESRNDARRAFFRLAPRFFGKN